MTHLLMIFDVTHVSNAGSWTRVSRVKAEYPNQLDYNGTYILPNLNDNWPLFYNSCVVS